MIANWTWCQGRTPLKSSTQYSLTQLLKRFRLVEAWPVAFKVCLSMFFLPLYLEHRAQLHELGCTGIALSIGSVQGPVCTSCEPHALLHAMSLWLSAYHAVQHVFLQRRAKHLYSSVSA